MHSTATWQDTARPTPPVDLIDLADPTGEARLAQGTGVAASLTVGHGPGAIGLRADMDALAVAEQAPGHTHASQDPRLHARLRPRQPLGRAAGRRASADPAARLQRHGALRRPAGRGTRPPRPCGAAAHGGRPAGDRHRDGDGGGAGDGPGAVPLHDAGHDFNDAILPVGACWFAELEPQRLPTA